MMNLGILETLGIVFSLGITSQWLGWKLKIPVIILLTLSGILVGPVFGLVNPHAVFGNLLHPLIELGVAIILFEGGLLLKASEYKKQSEGMKRLFSVSVLLNWGIGTLACYYIAGLSLNISLLICGLLIVTGPTVIMPALREARLKKRVSNYLKWEGIVNDPVGAILAILVYEYILFSSAYVTSGMLFVSLIKIVLISLGFSYGARWLTLWLTKKALIPEFLKLPFLVSSVIGLFALSESFQHGTGLMTVTLFGILLGNSDYSSLAEVKKLGESISIFTVSGVFIILSATMNMEIISMLQPVHYIFILLVAFVVRPISILISTIGSEMSFNERLLIGLYGPRGIVAASVAGAIGSKLTSQGIDEGKYILPIVFLVIIFTVVFHSFSLSPLANKLGLKNKGEHGVLIVGASVWSVQLAIKLRELKIPVLISDTSWYKLTRARIRGIDFHHGQAIADYDGGQVDLTEINYLIAANEDDHYNSLVCNKFSHVLGKEHVYQIAIHDATFRQQHGLGQRDICFLHRPDVGRYENLNTKYHEGWNFKSIEITEEFSLEDFKADEDNKDVILFAIVDDSRIVEFITPDHKLRTTTGNLIYYAA
jgi:NhaP-type Na+/H+ or K+/H+ antiporter